MASIAEGHARLSGTLVGAILQVDNALRSPELLLGEVADVLLRLFWANGRLIKLRSLPSQRLQADNNRVEVLSLPKVHSLEGLLSGHAAGLSTLHEGVDVLHALEGHGGGLDLLDLTGLEGVNHLAQQLSVLQGFVEIVGVSRLVDVGACDDGDPFQALGGLLFAVFCVDLLEKSHIEEFEKQTELKIEEFEKQTEIKMYELLPAVLKRNGQTSHRIT